MIKPFTIALIALWTAATLSSCATHEPAPSSTSQSADKKKSQQQGVGVGAESVNQPGRSDPSGANTGGSLEVGQDPLNEPGRADNQ